MPKLSSIDSFTKLSFPSSLIKKFMNSEIERKNYSIKGKEEQLISIGNSQLIITKSIEALISYIITEARLHLTKTNLGLYELQYIDIENAIYKNDELRENFLNVVLKYDKNIHYLVIDNKELINYLDTVDKNVKINNDVINFIQYLINYYCCEFLRIAFIVMKEYNKLRINSTIITICWNVMFIGKYHTRLMKDMEEMVNMIDNFKEEKRKEKEEKDGEKEEKKDEKKEDKKEEKKDENKENESDEKKTDGESEKK